MELSGDLVLNWALKDVHLGQHTDQTTFKKCYLWYATAIILKHWSLTAEPFKLMGEWRQKQKTQDCMLI